MTLKIIRTGKETKKKLLNNQRAVYNEMKFLQKKDREHFYVLHLDTKMNLTAKELISIGTLTTASIHPREVFKGAILNSSAQIIAVHNHPSGELTASEDDIKITKILKESGDIIGIPLADHVIIGAGTSLSILDCCKVETSPAAEENTIQKRVENKFSERFKASEMNVADKIHEVSLKHDFMGLAISALWGDENSVYSEDIILGNKLIMLDINNELREIHEELERRISKDKENIEAGKELTG